MEKIPVIVSHRVVLELNLAETVASHVHWRDFSDPPLHTNPDHATQSTTIHCTLDPLQWDSQARFLQLRHHVIRYPAC